MDNLAYQEQPWEELIGGNIIRMSPRPTIDHNRISGNIYMIFRTFLQGKTCEAFGDGVDLFLTEKDRFVPDGMIVCHKEFIKKDGIHGAPDLVVEVLSHTTIKNDRGKKMLAYAAAGVREYWIVSPSDKTIEVYLLNNGQYVLDNTYFLSPDYLFDKMTDEEKASLVTEFKCSIFEDLIIRLEDVFYRVL